MRFVAGRATEIEPGGRMIVYPDGWPQGVGIFNVGGRFHALKNVCPHQGAALCFGRAGGTSEARWAEEGPPDLEWGRNDEIITCPWHHWEFEIATGKTIFPSRNRVASYPVTVEPEVDERLRTGVQSYPVAVEDGRHLVELGTWASNQMGEVSARGSARVRLPGMEVENPGAAAELSYSRPT